MGLCVLLSAMHQSDTSLLRELNIGCDAVLINQCDTQGETLTEEGARRLLFLSTTDRGLSKSRNLAVKKASEEAFDRDDICIFCDNDCVYEDDSPKRILEAFDRNPDADIIVFFISRPERRSPVMKSEGPMGRMASFKIFSPEIAFRKKSILENALAMDERFGAGGTYGMGEENIFLFDAIAKGLKIVYCPQKIATLSQTESTWFKGYSDRYFVDRGAGYQRMSSALSVFFILQFAVRKYGLYKNDNGFFRALKMMFKGRNEILRNR